MRQNQQHDQLLVSTPVSIRAQKIPGTLFDRTWDNSVFNSTRQLQLRLGVEVAEAGIGTTSKPHLDEC
jgi:hypothetical protein